MGILELYLVNRMGLAEAQATQTLHLFGTAVYLLPLLGGWLADRGSGATGPSCQSRSCIAWGPASSPSLKAAQGPFSAVWRSLPSAPAASNLGVSAFVGDQFGPDQQHLLPRVYGWSTGPSISAPQAASSSSPGSTPAQGYRWAFALPGAAMGLATLFFWLGTKHYTRRAATPPSQRLHILPVLLYALTRCLRRKPGERFLDPALGRFSRKTSKAPAPSWASS